MPRATASLDPEDKVELKTCPGGFVVLRRLTYGQKLARSEHVGKLTVEMKTKRKGGTTGVMDMMQRASTLYDFKMCIVDHNLEDENGIKLDLTNPQAIDSLDPRIGEEISSLIDDLNNFEEDEEEGNS